MDNDTRRATPADILKWAGAGIVLAAMAATLVTWADTGALFAGTAWLDAYATSFVPLAMIAVIVAAQRVGLLTGIVVGLALAFAAIVLFEGAMGSYKWMGTFFLHALKMIIVPLIVFAMITGVAALGDVRRLGRLGGRTVLYYVVTTSIAVVIGAALVNLVQPGEGVALTLHEGAADKVAAASDAGLGAIILSFVSDNIVASMAQLEMLPIIVFSLVFGAVVTTIGEAGAPVIAFCRGANEAMMKIVHLVMVLAPVGVFGLIAGDFGERLAAAGTEALLAQLDSLASYSATVVGGLAVHALVVLPVLLWVTTGRSPLAYARGMGGALLTAFSTASSAATMPMTIEQVTDNNGVDDRAARFVIPLGATVNMDGTALYEAVAAIFIAQAYGIELGLGAQILIIITATLAAIGAAGIPQAGLVTLVMVLQAAGLPTEGVGLILAVDWLLDRFRTTVNVWGDAVGAAVMERHGLPPTEAAAAADAR